MVHKLGVIGAGVIGRLRARTVHEDPRTTLTAVFAPDPAVAAASAVGGAVPVTTLEAFFKKACEALHSHPEDYEEVAIVCGGA